MRAFPERINYGAEGKAGLKVAALAYKLGARIDLKEKTEKGHQP